MLLTSDFYSLLALCLHLHDFVILFNLLLDNCFCELFFLLLRPLPSLALSQQLILQLLYLCMLLLLSFLMHPAPSSKFLVECLYTVKVQLLSAFLVVRLYRVQFLRLSPLYRVKFPKERPQQILIVLDSAQKIGHGTT